MNLSDHCSLTASCARHCFQLLVRFTHTLQFLLHYSSLQNGMLCLSATCEEIISNMKFHRLEHSSEYWSIHQCITVLPFHEDRYRCRSGFAILEMQSCKIINRQTFLKNISFWEIRSKWGYFYSPLTLSDPIWMKGHYFLKVSLTNAYTRLLYRPIRPLNACKFL